MSITNRDRGDHTVSAGPGCRLPGGLGHQGAAPHALPQHHRRQVQHSTVQYRTVPYSTVQCSTEQYSIVKLHHCWQMRRQAAALRQDQPVGGEQHSLGQVAVGETQVGGVKYFSMPSKYFYRGHYTGGRTSTGTTWACSMTR